MDLLIAAVTPTTHTPSLMLPGTHTHTRTHALSSQATLTIFCYPIVILKTFPVCVCVCVCVCVGTEMRLDGVLHSAGCEGVRVLGCKSTYVCVCGGGGEQR